MILIVLAVVCALTVPLSGGKLGRLGAVRLRWTWIAPVALGLQVVIVTLAPGGNHAAHAAVHIGTYVLIGAFLWANRRIPGVPIIAAGTGSNALAIVVNGGVMPSALAAQRLAGMTVTPGFHNSAVLFHPHLLWLGDIIPVPGPMPNVLSVGDCFIYSGMLVLLHLSCRARPQMVRLGPGTAARSRTVGTNGSPHPSRPHEALEAALAGAVRG